MKRVFSIFLLIFFFDNRCVTFLSTPVDTVVHRLNQPLSTTPFIPPPPFDKCPKNQTQ